MPTTSIPTFIPTSISRLIVITALLLSGFLFSSSSLASTHTDFITEWRVPADDLILSFQGDGRYDINWGDGSQTLEGVAVQRHEYTAPGDYRVVVSNTITRFHSENTSGIEKLRKIVQWGDASWTSMRRAFDGASAMTITANDMPNLFGVTDMRGMFRFATDFVGNNIDNWDVSGVTDMSEMFSFATDFVGNNIDNWDVSGVTNMRGMFSSATAFNADISRWNVSSVTDMAAMFEDTAAFNADISNWNVSSVTNMPNMFNTANTFNQDISRWNVAGVTSMFQMFEDAAAFNADISNWNVASVTNMANMFNTANTFNQDISRWNVAGVTNMLQMFENAAAFNQDISNWNVASVTNMTNMFNNANAFNQNLGRWYVSPSPASPSPTLSAQNSVLIAQGPAYTLLAGDGDSHNNLFTLSSAGVLSPSDPNQVAGTYGLRIGISEGSSGVATFGSNNAVIIRVMIAATATATTPALYTISVPSDAELAAETSVAVAASTPTVSAVAGIAISAVTIDSTGGVVVSYAIAPAIGNGLSFDTSTGTISGTPIEIAPTVTYTITASNSAGSTTTTVVISVANAYSSSVMATAVINADATIITLGQSTNANNTIQVVGTTITLPSELRGATISIAEASNNVPTVQPLGTVANSRLSLVDIAVTGVSSNKPITICLPHGGIADPGLYHAATINAWNLLPSQQVVNGLVCGNAIAFSPFAVFGKRQDLAAVAEEQIINAVLPQLLRATTKMAVDNISRRIDQALDASGKSPAKLTIGSNSNLQQLVDNNIRNALQSELNVKQMFNNSSFLIPLNLAEDSNKGLKNMTLWGSANYLSLGDDVSGVDWDGEVIAANIGIDARLKHNLLAGAALAYSAGDVSYQRDGSANNRANNNGSGSLSNTLFSVHPYMAYKLSQGQLWGSLGIGQGELVIDDKTTDTSSDTFKSQRDTQLFGLALGGNRHLSSNDNWLSISGTTTLELKGEVSLSNIKLAKSQLSDSQALSIAAHRYRMALAASQQHRLAGGAKGSPSVEMGIRYDAGSGKTGASIELAGNYRYTSPKGLEMQLRAHTLLLHQSNYQEWGLSGLVKYQASRSGQGLRLSLQPAWGKTPTNVADRIWQASAITNYANAANDVDNNNKLQLNSELGYGLPGPYGHGLLTPYAGLGINNSEQSYNIGTRWTIDQKSKINLISEHKPSGDSIQLRGDFSF